MQSWPASNVRRHLGGVLCTETLCDLSLITDQLIVFNLWKCASLTRVRQGEHTSCYVRRRLDALCEPCVDQSPWMSQGYSLSKVLHDPLVTHTALQTQVPVCMDGWFSAGIVTPSTAGCESDATGGPSNFETQTFLVLSLCADGNLALSMVSDHLLHLIPVQERTAISIGERIHVHIFNHNLNQIL